jgi:hypothetical protein
MVQKVSVVVVEIGYSGAWEFRAVGAMRYLFAFCTRPDVAFCAEGYQFAFAQAAVALKIFTLDIRLFRAQLLHEFFGFIITLALCIQIDGTSTAI